MMKFSIWIIVHVLIVQQVFATQSLILSHDVSTWKKYANTLYSYEIAYPEQLELYMTGLKSKRDGKSFNIQFPEISQMHGLSVNIYPNKTIKQIIKEELSFIDIGSLEKATFEQSINKEQLIRISKYQIKKHLTVSIEFIHIPTDSVSMRMDVFDGVLFTFHHPFGHFNQEISNKIISSFIFHK